MSLRNVGLVLVVMMLFGAMGYLFIIRPQTTMWEYGTGKAEPSIMPEPAPRLPFSTEDVSVKTAESVFMQGEERRTQYVQAQGRAMVYEADMVIEVGEGRVQDSARKVMNVATNFNGYVSYSWIEEKMAVISIRVPADKLDLAMDAVRNLGKVKSENLNAYDVTDQLVDIEARLNNSRATERRLLEILSMAKDVNDVLMVEDRLKRVREEIEMLEAQLKNLKSSIDYSTLTVTIKEKKGLELPEFNFSRLLNMALTALYAAITLIVVGAFLATPLSAVGLVGLWVYRRIRKSK